MRKIILLFAAIICLITLLNISSWKKNVGGFVLNRTDKIEAGLSIAGKKTGSFFSFISEISKMKKQNAELSSKILSLEVDRSKISELEYENKMLKQELGYAQANKDHSLVPARIIGREPTNFLDHVMLDKGKNEGIASGMAVVSGGVLVGQVKDVYDDQSKVTLITSKDSVILAMLQKSRSKGILRGGISGLLLEDITRDSDFEKDEYVTTSGLDGQLEEGILIGRATTIQSSSGELFKSISVEPLADLSKLELVFIVQ